MVISLAVLCAITTPANLRMVSGNAGRHRDFVDIGPCHTLNHRNQTTRVTMPGTMYGNTNEQKNCKPSSSGLSAEKLHETPSSGAQKTEGKLHKMIVGVDFGTNYTGWFKLSSDFRARQEVANQAQRRELDSQRYRQHKVARRYTLH